MACSLLCSPSSSACVAEKLQLGFGLSAVIFGGAIALITAAHYALKLNAVLAFWLAYILTRPLGANIGDYLGAPGEEGGLGLGTLVTSVIFLGVALLVLVGTGPWPVGTGSPLQELLVVGRRWVTQVFAAGGARGIVLGVALGAVTTGLRVLLASDRPYAD